LSAAVEEEEEEEAALEVVVAEDCCMAAESCPEFELCGGELELEFCSFEFCQCELEAEEVEEVEEVATVWPDDSALDEIVSSKELSLLKFITQPSIFLNSLSSLTRCQETFSVDEDTASTMTSSGWPGKVLMPSATPNEHCHAIGTEFGWPNGRFCESIMFVLFFQMFPKVSKCFPNFPNVFQIFQMFSKFFQMFSECAKVGRVAIILAGSFHVFIDKFCP